MSGASARRRVIAHVGLVNGGAVAISLLGRFVGLCTRNSVFDTGIREIGRVCARARVFRKRLRGIPRPIWIGIVWRRCSVLDNPHYASTSSLQTNSVSRRAREGSKGGRDKAAVSPCERDFRSKRAFCPAAPQQSQAARTRRSSQGQCTTFRTKPTMALKSPESLSHGHEGDGIGVGIEAHWF